MELQRLTPKAPGNLYRHSVPPSTQKTTNGWSSELLSQFQTFPSDGSKILFYPLLVLFPLPEGVLSDGRCHSFPPSNSTQKTTKNSSSELLSQFQTLLSDGSRNPLLVLFQKSSSRGSLPSRPPAITAGRVGLVRFAPARKAVSAPNQRHLEL